MSAEGINPDVEHAVEEFVRLDDEVKTARKELKTVAQSIQDHKKVILEYMSSNEIDRLGGIKNDTQYLECTKKVLKRRPSSVQMLERLTQFMRSGERDPQIIMEGLITCGGTYTEFRLARRSRRVNAATLLSEAKKAAASTRVLKKKATKKKQK